MKSMYLSDYDSDLDSDDDYSYYQYDDKTENESYFKFILDCFKLLKSLIGIMLILD